MQSLGQLFYLYGEVEFVSLQVIKQCLWFILEPLITRNDFYCYGFYKNLVERMKNHKDAIHENDDAFNFVSTYMLP
ncbi:hypothetical protein RR46_00041 [Papilio xuthus]|uniref:Uncharacterized protein n=1 Tax=Papilio xuthus TaxID=66420 RepID=A0A0N1IQD0_PAPXU|nr:hypothetical protein RR46_00041 [Papilio xuthus]